MIERCIQIAAIKHQGIFDKSGEKSIYHLVRVMLDIKHHGEIFAAVGVLHDIIEDTDITYEQLKRAMIDEEVIDALKLTTRLPNETYAEYIERGLDSGNVIFPIYKLADIYDHLRPEKIDDIPDSLIKRYKKAEQKIRDHQRKISLKDPEFTTDEIELEYGVTAKYIGTSNSFKEDQSIHYIEIHCPGTSKMHIPVFDYICEFDSEFSKLSTVNKVYELSELDIERIKCSIFDLGNDFEIDYHL